jgi:hypothetical protein
LNHLLDVRVNAADKEKEHGGDGGLLRIRVFRAGNLFVALRRCFAFVVCCFCSVAKKVRRRETRKANA